MALATTLQTDVHRRDIVVIGGSAGASEALYALLPDLPRALPASLFVLLHRTWRYGGPDLFPEFLARKANLPVKMVSDQQSVEAGMIYLAPPDAEMFFEFGRIRIQPCPTEHLFRSGIDTLFRLWQTYMGPELWPYCSAA